MFFSVLAYGARTDQKSRAEYSGQTVSKGGQPWRKSARPDNASKDERLTVHNCKHTRPNPSGPNNDQECTKPSGRLKPRISVRSSFHHGQRPVGNARSIWPAKPARCPQWLP